MKDKCKKYSKELGCCMMLSDFSQPMPMLQPCIESPCKHYKPYTNFDKITSSMESLAEFIVEETSDLRGSEIIYYAYGESCPTYEKEEAIKSTIEWLKREVDDA